LANLKRTTEQFKEDVFKKHGNKVEILSEYIGQTDPIDFVYHCEKHGDIYKTINAKNIFGRSFQPCEQCRTVLKSIKGKLAVKKDKSFHLKRLQDYCISKGGKLISTEWTKAKNSYEIDCGNPDHPNFITSADSLLNKNGQWCPYCSGRKGDFNTRYKEIIENNDGIMLSDYINGTTHIKVKCNKDGYVWDIYPSNIIKGRWCPICNLPYSEKVPYDYLTNNNYNIIVQYTFDDLKGETNELLKYDFAITNNKNNLLGLIEIDDEEHRYNHTQPRRVKARERDRIKDKYCKDNNIPLLRVEYYHNKKFEDYGWYYEYIDNNLKDFLHKLENIDNSNKNIIEGGIGHSTRQADTSIYG